MVPFAGTPYQKYTGLYLDEKLNFNHRINVNILKANMESLKRLSSLPPKNSLLTICKSFIRPHLDYCDINYEQLIIKVFLPKLNKYRTILPLL